MTDHGNRWIRAAAVLLGIVFLLGLLGYVWFQNHARPYQRSNIDASLFTVGDASYAQAMEDGKQVVTIGRMPLGLYPGGLAFSDPEDARQYLRDQNQTGQWGIYRLSGDYGLDTTDVNGQRYTTRSLMVIERLPD